MLTTDKKGKETLEGDIWITYIVGPLNLVENRDSDNYTSFSSLSSFPRRLYLELNGETTHRVEGLCVCARTCLCVCVCVLNGEAV